jgi:ribokinase
MLDSMGGIVVLGSLNMDLVVTLPRLPGPGETVIGDRLQKVPGGKGANQALAAARLGGEVAIVGRVGADEFGITIVEGLVAEGVDVCGVERDSSEPTGVALIEVDARGQNSIAVAPGANGRVGRWEVRRTLDRLRKDGVLVLQQEVPAEAVKDAARRAKELGASVVLNAAPRRGEDRELLRSVDVLVVNESEVQDFAGREVHDPESAAAAAAAVLAMGVPAVVVTLGPAGAVAGQGSETFFVKAFGISPVDTTAAGDAFVGALVVALVEGKELRVAAQLGAAAGALAATKPGAQTSLPRRHDLRESFGVDWSSV